MNDHRTLPSRRQQRHEQAPGRGPRRWAPGVVPGAVPCGLPPPGPPLPAPGRLLSSPPGCLLFPLQPWAGRRAPPAAHLVGSMWASVSIWPGLSCGPPTEDMLCRGRARAVTALPVAGRPASRTSSVTPPAWLTGFTAARSFMTAGSRRGWGQRCRQSPAPSPAGCAVPSCVQEGPIAATVPRASRPHGTRDRGREARAGAGPGRAGWTRCPLLPRSKPKASSRPQLCLLRARCWGRGPAPGAPVSSGVNSPGR